MNAGAMLHLITVPGCAVRVCSMSRRLDLAQSVLADPLDATACRLAPGRSSTCWREAIMLAGVVLLVLVLLFLEL